TNVTNNAIPETKAEQPKPNTNLTPTNPKRIIAINDQDLINVVNTDSILLVKLKDIESMSNMYTICRNEDFLDLNIHHVGGYWIWIQFPSSTACSKFQENESLKSFGKFLFFEKEDSSALSSGRVCISTKSHRLISENVQVEINKELFEATVQEIGSWCTKINDDYIDISSNGKLEDLDISSESILVSKLALWNRLQDFMHHHNGSYIMFGDMNVVRNEQERVGSIFNNIEADHFNSFIDATDVIDLLLDIRITTLDMIWSDHNPIILHVDKIDFGPSSFKLYNFCLLRDGFDDLIKSEWELLDSNKIEFPTKCHKKFRILKAKIRLWNNNNKTMDRNKKVVALEEITSIKKKIDEGSASPSNTENRLNLLHELEKIDKLASMDLIQEARVKWDIEGDENSKLFHGLINQKRQNQMINGIMVEGTWITDPSLIKDAFFQFYNDKFQAQDSQVLFPNLPHSHTLNSTEQDYLEKLVTLEEIKEAVWDCGSSKPPGPDSDLDINCVLGLKPIFHLQEPLVNGSPTSEFSINRGLRQGDPLSPFLFILVMEDDVIITTDWNARDLENIIRVLHVFYLASGLKINIHKSNIYGNIPFNYLGLPISSNMKSIASWKMLVDSFHLRLSTWKANLLSIGGRLTLIKYNRLYRLNQDKDCLIIDRINNEQWHWNWSKTNLGVQNLAYFRDMLNEIGQVNIEVSEDTCVWSLGPKGTFTVKDARNIIDQKTLPSLAPSTTWDKTIPRKVNIFMWRLSLDRLPHNLNLSLRGMDIPAISCSSCNANVESTNHIFFECIIATEMWKLVYRWCEIHFVQASTLEAFKYWFISWHAFKEKKHRLYVISTSVLWWLWRYRNSVTFNSQPLRKSGIFDYVRSSLFSWLHNRGKLILSWTDWLKSPLLTRAWTMVECCVLDDCFHVSSSSSGFVLGIFKNHPGVKIGGSASVFVRREASRSRSRGRPRTARKHRKNVSKKKGTSKSHRSVRSEARSRLKSKSVKSKPQSVMASRRKSSSDSGYDIVSDSGLEDLSMTYRRPKPMPFTTRITRFRYHRRAKLPPNVWVYEGNKDSEDHLSIFSAAAEQEEWPMPVWCKMFR
ncbi:RNA-directed DNA polymerase, eukaryota, reverse transcriptase zinc-binding domain protein, partial [Tanacetum coccineum]